MGAQQRINQNSMNLGKETGEATVNSIVCILGMHRSGTSCLAGCLEERGLQLGELVDSAPYNRRGNKENVQLRAINEDVLALSGGSWDRPPERLVWNDALRQRRDDHVANHRSYQIWGFKDPRTVLTLPFWLEACPDMRLVGTFRHPRAVAQSLMRRPALKPALSPMVLWKYYNLKMLEYVAQFRFPLVSFDWPAAAYVCAIEDIAQCLGLQEMPDATSGFFEDNLRNNDLSAGENIPIGIEEMSIYEKLMSHAI